MVFLVSFMILVLFSLLSVAFFTLMERRFLGNFHLRNGPIMVGPLGLFQPFSDAIKLFSKSDSFLRYLDFFSWGLAPMIALCIYIFSLVGFPCSGGEMFMDNLYLLFICFLSLSVYFFMYGGFHSGSKYSMLGSYRSVTQMISYEVILIFMFVSIFYLMKSWNLTFKNFEYFGFNFYFCLPFFFCWIMVMMVESNRLPYDFLEGESELVSGFNTEYWGGYFSFFFIYEYGSMLLFSLISGFFLFSGWFCVCVFILIMVFYLWLRSSVPRYRYDFLMDLAWKKILLLIISILEFFIFF